MDIGKLPQAAQDALDELLQRNDPSIIGIVLSGSVARGTATEHSNVDVIVVREENPHELSRGISHSRFIDEIPMTLEELEEIRPLGSEGAWDRWSFAWAQILRDSSSNSRVTKAVQRRPVLDDQEICDRLTGGASMLDCFLNLVHLALKSHRNGQAQAARLDAAESVTPMLDVIFSLAGRVRPYNKYLAWELREHPLPMSFPEWEQDFAGRLLLCVEGLLDGEEKSIHEAFHAVEWESRAYEMKLDQAGLLSSIIEHWDDEALQLMRG